MTLKAVSFLALVFTALALVPAGSHLMSLPNKLGMTQEQYFIAQRAYDGWALSGFVLIPAVLLNIALAILLRGQGAAFAIAAAGAAALALTLVLFFAFTQPANAATQNWRIAPADWEALRTQWEYSHAAGAGLNFLSLCMVALAMIWPRSV
jgi:hypothetical protein